MTSEFGGDLFGDEPPPPTPPKKTGGKDRSTSVQKVHLKSRARAEAADDLLFPPAGEHAAEEPTPAPRREEPRRHEARREEGRRTEARGDEPRRHERRDESRREGRGQRERQGQEQGARGAGAEAQPRGEGERERGRGGHERRERGRHGQERAAERRGERDQGPRAGWREREETYAEPDDLEEVEPIESFDEIDDVEEVEEVDEADSFEEPEDEPLFEAAEPEVAQPTAPPHPGEGAGPGRRRRRRPGRDRDRDRDRGFERDRGGEREERAAQPARPQPAAPAAAPAHGRTPRHGEGEAKPGWTPVVPGALPRPATATQRVALFLDVDALQREARNAGGQVSFSRAVRQIAGSRAVARAVAYCTPQSRGTGGAAGIETVRVERDSDTTVAIAVDALATASRVDCVVIAPESAAAAPLVRALRAQGVRVESAGFEARGHSEVAEHQRLGKEALFVP
ncbi:MAG TPA: NYN domain-containing protein [Planctomycetota bacterium]|nr:NYN domain-containing protein [Planctomycetota bacterium]